MQQCNEWLLMTLAYAVALLLLGLGVRTLPNQKNGRRSFFMAALSFFITGETLLAREAGATQIDPAASAEASTGGRATATDLPLPPEFSAPGKWQAFRSFWQKVSDIDTRAYHPGYSGSSREAKAGASENRFEHATVKGVLTHEESKALEDEFTALFPGHQPFFIYSPARLTAETSSSPSRMGQLLNFILHQRLAALGFDRSMMTRMALPSSSLYPRSIYQRIEVRIDLLLDKQATGEISATEYAAIIASIENDMHLSAFIAATSDISQYGYYVQPRLEGNGEGLAPEIGIPFGRHATLNGSPLFDNPQNWLRGWEHAIDLRQKHLQEQISSVEQAKSGQVQDAAPKLATPPRFLAHHAPSDPAKALADLKESAARTRTLLTELESLREPLRLLLADLERRP